MNNFQSNDPINRIKNALRDHEEPYHPGSWEQFRQQQIRKQRILMFRTVSGIAASLLVATTVVMGLIWTNTNEFTGFFSFDHSLGTEQIPSEMIMPDDEQPDEKLMDDELMDRSRLESPDRVRDSAGDSAAEMAELTRDVERSGAPDTHWSHRDVTAVDRDENLIMQGEPEVPVSGRTPGAISESGDRLFAGHTLPASSRFITINKTERAKPLLMRAESNAELAADMRTAEYAEVETARNGSVTAREERKYQLGISYGPSINMHQRDTRWGLGAGVNLDRKITRNLSISSGIMIAQNRMQYDDDRHVLESDQQGSFARTGNEQDQEMNTRMEADLISFEVPLNLKFSLTDQFYVITGISSATFVREQYDYRTEYEQEFTQLAFEDGAGFRSETTTVMVSETEHQSESSFSSFHPLAFYNIAVGYNRYGTDRSRFSFEPYLKIPTGNLTSRDIRYTTAGIQMVISL